MDISKKIEEIRNKPEHIRERYLWISLLISMLIIIGLWFLSMKTSFDIFSKQENLDKVKGSFSEIKNTVEENMGSRANQQQ